MYPENPEGTQVIVGSMNMGYISDTARNRISRKEISHPSIGVKSYECFTFLTSNDVSLHQFIGTLCHCKLNILDYYESLGNHEKPGLEETWSCLGLVTSHIIFLSNQAQLLKPRLDENWVCQTLFMWIIFFKIVTLNLGVVNNNQLESVVTWYVFQYTISYMSDYSWSLKKKISSSDRLSTLDCWMYLKLCGCSCPFLACFVLQWLIQIPEIP